MAPKKELTFVLQGKYVNDSEQLLSENDLLTLEQLKKENRELKDRYILELLLYILLSSLNLILLVFYVLVIDYRGRRRKF